MWRVSGLLELFIFIYIRKLFFKKKYTTKKLDRRKSQKENLAKAKQKKVDYIYEKRFLWYKLLCKLFTVQYLTRWVSNYCKATANFVNFEKPRLVKWSTIICNCTGNKDEIFIDRHLLHSRYRLLIEQTSFVLRAYSSLACMSPTEAGKVFSRRVLFVEFIITVYFCPEIYHREKDFLLSF